MKYMGSKNRLSKNILPIMLEYRVSETQYWVEPFVGGGNMIDKVKGNRIGSDINKYTIEALIAIRDKWHLLPRNKYDFTEEMYNDIKKNDNARFKGYYGYTLSYGGKWLGGWRRDKENKRDYVKEAYLNAVKQSKNIQGVKLYCLDYKDLEIPKNSIIYCDPPYKNTTKYSKNSFDYNIFYNWLDRKKEEGHIVFFSEYDAPKKYKCVFQKELTSSLTKNTGAKKGIEKLFLV